LPVDGRCLHVRSVTPVMACICQGNGASPLQQCQMKFTLDVGECWSHKVTITWPILRIQSWHHSLSPCRTWCRTVGLARPEGEQSGGGSALPAPEHNRWRSWSQVRAIGCLHQNERCATLVMEADLKGSARAGECVPVNSTDAHMIFAAGMHLRQPMCQDN
jgi:hypothetical protein